jgi:hypothetical protein
VILSLALVSAAPGHAADFQLSLTPEPSYQSDAVGSIPQGAPVGPLENGPRSQAAPPPPIAGAPPLLTSWEGNNFDTTIPLNGSIFIPPDPHGASGPAHVVNVTNVMIEWYQKNSTLDSSQLLATFFAPLVPLTTLFDPKVLYDQHEGRFVVVALERTDDPNPPNNPGQDTSRILVAVSKTSDPNGGWWFHSINSKVTINISGIGPLPFWADYPGLGVDEDAVYITNNMFVFPSTGFAGFGGVRLWIVHKGVVGGFYSGNPATVTIHDPDVNGVGEFTMQPAHVFGTVPGAVNTFLVSGGWSTDFSVGPAGTEALSVTTVTNPLGAVAFSQKFVLIADIEDATIALPDAPQDPNCPLVHADEDPPGIPIDTGDRRALNAVWRSGSLWTTNTALPKAGADINQATTHWYELDTNQAGCPVINFGGVGAEDLSPTTWTYWSQIAVDGCGNMAIGFAASSPTLHAGAYYTGRRASDAFGFVQTTGTLMPGQDCYRRTFCAPRNRWGDYSGISVDPTDDCTFWIYNEYAAERGTPTACGAGGTNREYGRWATRWGAFRLNEAPVALCKDVNVVGVEVGGVCQATVGASDVDDGSFDPDGDPINFTLTPSGPYPSGTTNVQLIVDDGCKADTCTAQITVECPVPVKLTAFSVARSADGAVLDWTVADAIDHAGFHVYRQQVGAERVRISDGLITGGPDYTFVDETAPAAQTDYWLAELDRTGSTTWFGPVTLSAGGAVAPAVALSPGKPNPFSASTAIRFSVPEGGHVKLAVYSMNGRLVATLHDGFSATGEHLVEWDGRTETGSPASAGLYFVRLIVGSESHVQKLVYSR